MAEKILIVENNVTLQARPLQLLLEEHGYEVTAIAKTVASAVKQFEKTQPDLVLMDIWIPQKKGQDDDEEGGITAARRIRDIADTQIIYMTDKNIPDDVLAKATDTSPFEFLTKPHQDEQVLTSVRRSLLKTRGKKLVFLCYSHKDSAMREELHEFLLPLRGIGIDTWVDSAEIPLGARWRSHIASAVSRADAAILFVSNSFMNSEFIREFEVPELLSANVQRGLIICPAFLEYVSEAALRGTELSEFQGVNNLETPLDTMEQADRKKVWKRLADQLAKQLTG